VEKFKEIWWNLPRKDTRIFVQSISVYSQDTSVATERLCATIKMQYIGSKGVMKKTGFTFCGELQKDGDMYGFWQNISPKKWAHPLS